RERRSQTIAIASPAPNGPSQGTGRAICQTARIPRSAPLPGCRLHCALNIVELVIDLLAEHHDDRDDHAGDGGNDQAVLDGGGALLVLEQFQRVLQHRSSPSGLVRSSCPNQTDHHRAPHLRITRLNLVSAMTLVSANAVPTL